MLHTVLYSVGGGALARMVPSSFVTRAINPEAESSFAGLRSIVTVSPGCSIFGDHPARARIPGGRPSAFQSTLLPFPSSTVRIPQTRGLVHLNSLTTPLMVMTFVT